MIFGLNPYKTLKWKILPFFFQFRTSYRLILLLILPAVPIGWESVLISENVYQEIVSTEEKKNGMLYLNYLNQLLRYTQQNREYSYLSTVIPTQENIQAFNNTTDRIRSLIPVIESLNERNKNRFIEKNFWDGIKKDLIELTESETVYTPALAERQDKTVQEVINMTRHVLARSGMLNDPDRLSYHLVYAGLKDLPELMNEYSKGKTLIDHVMRDGKISGDDREKIVVMLGRSRIYVDDVTYNMNSISNMDLSIKYIIEPNYLKLIEKTEIYIDELEKVSDVNQVNRDYGNTMLKINEESIQSMYQFQTMIYNSLQYVYSTKIDNLWFYILLSMVITVIIFVTTLVLAIVIVASITSPLEVATDIAVKLSSGKLAQDFPVIGKDELSRLMNALKTMAVNLSGMIISVYATARETNRSAMRLSDASDKFTSTAQEQAAAAEEASGAMVEMRNSTDGIAESITRSARSMKDIESTLNELSDSIEDETHQMEGLTNLAKNTADHARGSEELIHTATMAMRRIVENTNKITEFTSIITEISDQTNLLSLNAAIEAARAGDSGRGFAIVAQEITKLAERTMESVKEVKSLIGETLNSVNDGSDKVRVVADNLGIILSDVKRMDEFVQIIMDRIRSQGESTKSITNYSRMLSEGADDIQQRIQDQNHAAKELERTLGDLAKASSVVSGNSNDLNQMSKELEHRFDDMLSRVGEFEVIEDAAEEK